MFTGGVSYLVRPELQLGAAFGFAEFTANLGGSLTNRNFDGAAFAAFARENFHAEALATFGFDAIDQTRVGSFGALKSRPDATVLGTTIRAAYDFDVGGFKIGPLAEASYTQASLGGFSEGGDPFYAAAATAQSARDLVGGFGFEVCAANPASWPASPFANVLVERRYSSGPASGLYMAALPTQSLPEVALPSPTTAICAIAGAEFSLGGDWVGRVSGTVAAGTGASADFGVTGGVAYRY